MLEWEVALGESRGLSARAGMVCCPPGMVYRPYGVGYRIRIGVVQIAVFVGGGLVCPVVHMAWHPPNHSHGAGERTVAFDLSGPIATAGDPTRPAPGPPSSLERSSRHERGHPHPHPHPHEHPPENGGRGHSVHRPRTGGDSRHTAEGSPPLAPGHGHGSIAHLGFALLSASPPLALPPPEPAGVVPLAPDPRAAALFQASFPLPRPPPAAALF
jgi:hypothetical protein